jgi:predicted PurR-regulated permease PerM
MLPPDPVLPSWLQTLGRGAWLLVGLAVAVMIALLLAGLVSNVLIPLIFAAILAAIFVPVVDRLQRWRLPRWLGAPVVVLIAIAVVVTVGWMVVAGVLREGDQILARVSAGFDEAGSIAGASPPTTDQAVKLTGDLVAILVQGLVAGLGSVTVLIVGIVTGLFILLYLLKDWQTVFDWTADRLAGLLGRPGGVGRQVLTDTAGSFRAYALGLTVIGLMNAVIIGLGALLLGVPLALPIAIVTFVTSYIPFFGAFFAGAFAVVVALGANGLSTALAILAITLLANNTLQNLLEPVAFGRTLQLHPLTVLLVTSAATLLFGVLGATLAAPVTAVTLRTVKVLRETDAADATDGRPSDLDELAPG